MQQVMRLPAIGLAFFLCASAFAEPVPKSIRDSFMPGQTKSITLDQGVLKIALNVLAVDEGTYRSIAVAAGCLPIMEDRRLAPRITRIEVLNDIGKQGYALQGGGKSCVALEPMNREQSDRFFAENTVPCVAGYCQ